MNVNINREKILEIRMGFLTENPKAFAGNTKERLDYLKKLECLKPELTPLQAQYLVGLNLGDLSVDIDHSKKTARFKIQQSVAHVEWLEHIREIFLEYMPSDLPISSPSAKRPTIREIQSLKCKTLYNFLVPLFYPNKGTRKGVYGSIENYISPVSVAALFCGDGSKADHTDNSGKGITFHTQGFTKSENELLAGFIRDKVGMSAQAKEDGLQHGQWRIDISGTSFEIFCEKVGPWVYKTFHKRVPSGRAPNPNKEPRFGYMTQDKRDSLLGVSLKNLHDQIVSY